MTAPRPVPRWELQRQQWAAPTSTIHALRRARARAAYNRRRQAQAQARRRMLAALLRRNGFDPLGDLAGAGNQGLYRQYYEESGRSYRTFLRDIAWFRAHGRLAAGDVRPPAPTPTWPSASPGQSVTPPRSPTPSPTPTSVPIAPSPAPSPAAAASPALASVSVSVRCPMCGRIKGLPGRSSASSPPSPWLVQYLVLRRVLERMVPPELEQAVLVRARQELARLALPRRVWGALRSLQTAPPPQPAPPPPPSLPSPASDRSGSDSPQDLAGGAFAGGPVASGMRSGAASAVGGPTTAMLLGAVFGRAPSSSSPQQQAAGSQSRRRRAAGSGTGPARDPTDWW